MVIVRVLCPTLVAAVGSHPHPGIGSPNRARGRLGHAPALSLKGEGKNWSHGVVGAVFWAESGVSWEMVNCRRRRGASA